MTTAVITQNSTAQNATADDIYTGVTDTRLAKDSPTISFNTNASLEASNTSSSVQRTTLIKFTGLSNIPSGATITSATLWLRIETSSATYNVDLRRVLLDWTSSATWNTKDGTNSWNSSGCRGDGTDRVSTPMDSPSVGATAGTWYSWDCTQYVQDIVDGTNTDYGLHLERADTGNDGAAKKFNSSDSNNGYRPELVVVYTVSSGTTLTASGISSAESVGNPVITTGAVTVLPSGVATAELFGSPLISPTYQISPSGISSAESVGNPTIDPGSVGIGPAPIGSSEAFGSATVSQGGVFVLPSAISSVEAFGSSAISPGGVFVLPAGISSAEAFGLAVVTSGAIIAPASIATLEAFGLVGVSPGVVVILPTGIQSGEAFGAAQIGDVVVAGNFGIVSGIVSGIIRELVK